MLSLYRRVLLERPAETCLGHFRRVSAHLRCESSRHVAYVRRHVSLHEVPCRCASAYLETYDAVLLDDVRHGHVYRLVAPVQRVWCRSVGKLGVRTCSWICVSGTRVLVVNAVGRLDVHAAVVCVVVGTVHAPVLVHHFLCIVIVVYKQSVSRYVRVPAGLLPVFKHKPLVTRAGFAVGLCVDVSRLVCRDIVERHVLGVFQLNYVGVFLCPSHLQTLESHQAGRRAAVVVVTARSVQAVRARVNSVAVCIIVGVIHVLQTENVSELVGERSDAVHRRHSRRSGHAHKLGGA